MSASRSRSSAELAIAARDADAGRDRDRACSCIPPSVNGWSRASSRRSAISSGAGGRARAVGDHHELVAAEAPERVGLAHDRRQPRCDRAQQLVAGAVAERVVDRLEVVEIDEQRGDRGSGCGARASSICSTRSRISVRLGRPVSASWVARNASSCWRARAPRGRAGARTRRTRTSAPASRRGCAEASPAPARVPRGRDRARAALSRTTSAAASRQRRQRLVTSFSGAARCAASWPKICQASCPTSRATSAPSPAIQRATATVETAPTSFEARLRRPGRASARRRKSAASCARLRPACACSARVPRRVSCISIRISPLPAVPVRLVSPRCAGIGMCAPSLNPGREDVDICTNSCAAHGAGVRVSRHVVRTSRPRAFG